VCGWGKGKGAPKMCVILLLVCVCGGGDEGKGAPEVCDTVISGITIHNNTIQACEGGRSKLW